jgi:hypothetical protein
LEPKIEWLKKMKSLNLPFPRLLRFELWNTKMSKIGIGLIAVGGIVMAGATAFILRRRHANHQKSYDNRTGEMEQRLQATISEDQDESDDKIREERVQSVVSTQEPLNEWNRKSWLEKAIFSPPILLNEVEMQELNTSSNSSENCTDSAAAERSSFSTSSSLSSDEAAESGEGDAKPIITDEESFGSFYKGAPAETEKQVEDVGKE